MSNVFSWHAHFTWLPLAVRRSVRRLHTEMYFRARVRDAQQTPDQTITLRQVNQLTQEWATLKYNGTVTHDYWRVIFISNKSTNVRLSRDTSCISSLSPSVKRAEVTQAQHLKYKRSQTKGFNTCWFIDHLKLKTCMKRVELFLSF